MNVISIDNGATGSIASIIAGRPATFQETPIRRCREYTIKEQYLQRIDYPALVGLLTLLAGGLKVKAVLERPMVNPGRFRQSGGALRAYEATILALEALGIPYETVDSKRWQSVLLPGIKGPKELKGASAALGVKLYPHLAEALKSHGDADSLLMAKWYLEKGDAKCCSETK